MARLNSMVVMMIVTMVAAIQLQSAIAETRHIVGGELGWTIPPNGASSYTSWASEQTFRVGDTLVFNFTTGAHNVAEVSQTAYGPCTTANSKLVATNAPATFTLRSSGKHYFVCTVGCHCQIGQKLTINVAAASSTPLTAPSPAPTATIPLPPTTPSQPSPSSAASFTGALPIIMLVAAVAFLFVSS